MVGLWGATDNVTDAARRVRDSGADEVVTTLADAVQQLAKLAPPLAEQMIPAPISAEEKGASGDGNWVPWLAPDFLRKHRHP